MRFSTNVAFGLFSVALMGFNHVVADELDDKLGDAAKVEGEAATSTAIIDKPTFTVSRTELHLDDSFVTDTFSPALPPQGSVLRAVHR